MTKTPLVSVIIPFFNREVYLAEAIESVLSQTYHPMEIILVDDGSTDNSAPIAKQHINPSIKYIYQENQGIGAALNTGIEHAEGDYISFLDSDDLWMKNKTEIQISVFLSHPNIDMVFGHVVQIYHPEISKKHQGKANTIFPGCTIITMLVERLAFFTVGRFSTEWRAGSFLDWYARAIELELTSFMLPDVIASRRIHETNFGIVEKESKKDITYILKAALDRRRKIK